MYLQPGEHWPREDVSSSSKIIVLEIKADAQSVLHISRFKLLLDKPGLRYYALLMVTKGNGIPHDLFLFLSVTFSVLKASQGVCIFPSAW